MSVEPEISVIIPCYNDGKYLQAALDSLDQQRFQNFEIILVDDASTEHYTQELLERLEHPKLKIVRLSKNSGPAVARNRGIEAAKGRYILPLDADDKIAPSYLQRAKEILDERDEVGIVYCRATLFGERWGEWQLPPYSFPEILTGNMIFATAMYRYDDWKEVGGYNENMRQGNEDYDFWLSLIERGCEVYQIPETLFYYRIKHSSRTTQLLSDPKKKIDTLEQIYHNHKQLYMEHMRVFFEVLDQKERFLAEKDREIRRLHLIQQRLEEQLDGVGKELTYARDVVRLRDAQLALKNEQIAFLTSLTVKRRIKEKLRRVIPNSILKLFGFRPYVSLQMPERSFESLIPISPQSPSYSYTAPTMDSHVVETIRHFREKPLISIIMPVYNVDPKWLRRAIESVEAQWYEHWELCIADDKSSNEETLHYLRSIENPKIKIRFLEQNLNISGASNAALALAEGEYIALLDNDDELTPDALYEMVKTINETDADFIYSDEDFIDTKGNCSNPHFKPDFSPDLLLSHNYITHFVCFRRALLEETGAFNSAFDGAQDYDLFLRLTERSGTIRHIPKVLYHWRTLESSTSANAEAKPEAIERGRKVLEAAIARRGIDATVEHANLPHYFRVKYAIKGEPLVSIIIPFKDKPELLEMSIGSILERSTYQNYEIIGISNNSQDPKVFEVMRDLEAKDPRVKFHEYNIEFNYAKINNYAVERYAKGEHIVLLNNDIEVISPDWIGAMLEHSQREEIGCVGAKLYYPDDTVQHAGVIVGLGGYAGHSHKMYPRENPGYFNRLNVIQNVSAVTAACLMVKKRLYQEVGGMDDEAFKVAYNDVDFCLRIRERGYWNLFTPYAQMYHHESISRGYETTPEKIARFTEEKKRLFRRHAEILIEGDPFYNPNLTQDKEDFSLCVR